MDGNCQQWFIVVLALIGLVVFLVIMFMNYTLKVKDRQIVLEKHQKEIKKEVQEVERVNGKEKRDIAELQSKMEKIEQKFKEHA